MRKKYADCRRADGNCTACSLVNYGRDCHNRPITTLEGSRRRAGRTQAETGNLTARNLIAIADALGVDVRSLI